MAKIRDLVVLRHVGDDSRCQNDLLICTCPCMRSVYCCHHLKQKRYKNVLLSFRITVIVVIWFCWVSVRMLGIVNKVMADGVWEYFATLK